MHYKSKSTVGNVNVTKRILGGLCKKAEEV